MNRAATVRTLLLASLALSIGSLGCSKKEETAGPGETGESPAAVKAATLEVPASIVGYGGTADIKKTVESLHKLAIQVTPQVPPQEQLHQLITGQIQNAFRLKDVSAIDLGKPIRFAFADPKAFGRDPSAFIFGITGKDALAKALPELERKADDAGNAHSYLKFEGSKAPVYVNFIGDGYAVFSRHAEVFPKHKDFLGKLVDAPMPDHGGAFVELDHLLAVYGAEFDKGVADAKREMSQAAAMTPGGAQQGEMIAALVDWVATHSRQVDQVRVSLASTDAGVKLDLRIQPLVKSDLAKIFELAKGTDHALLGKIPKTAVAAASSATNVEALVELTRRMGAMFIAPLLGEGANVQGYVDSMVKMAKASTGTFAFGVIDSPDGNGLTPVGLYGLEDAAQARAAQVEVAKMNEDPAFKAMYEKTGVSVTYQNEAYKVGDVPVAVQTTTMNNMPPEAAMMMGMMGDLMTQHIAFGEDLGVIGYGQSARPIIEQYLGGKVEGGFADKPGVKEALDAGAENPSFFGYVEPLALVQRLKLGGMNPLAATLAGVESDGGFAISLGAEGGVLQTVIWVPVKTVKQGVAAFEKSKGLF